MSSPRVSEVVTFTFALDPDRTLRVSLHRDVKDPRGVRSRMLNEGRYAMMDARRIVSSSHVAIAANAALLRSTRRDDVGSKAVRGVAAETVFCAGGSSNAGNVVREFAWEEGVMSGDVLVLGFDCTDDAEYVKALEGFGLSAMCDLGSYLSRERSREDIDDVRKAYKITEEEMNMTGSSLERAVLNRIATKFVAN